MNADTEIVVAMVALHLQTIQVELPMGDALAVARQAVNELTHPGRVISADRILVVVGRARGILRGREAEVADPREWWQVGGRD